jgi:hypothetical protein
MREREDGCIPPWTYAGPYNVEKNELQGHEGPIWRTSPELPEFSDTEFERVRTAVVRCLLSAGVIASSYGQEEGMFVWDDGYFDQTIRIEYYEPGADGVRLAIAIEASQSALRTEPLWRTKLNSRDASDSMGAWLHRVMTRKSRTDSDLQRSLRTS